MPARSYLEHLLQQTGGDWSAVIAGYYQGLGSPVRAACSRDPEVCFERAGLRSRFGG